jgi:hypothetical protein
MALARVVSFEGVDKARIEELKSQIEDTDRPEGLNPSEIIVLHDADSSESLTIIVFDSEEDYRRGDEVLNAMPTGDTPGQRTGVRRYDVGVNMKM